MLHNLKKKLWLQILIIYSKYLIGGAFVFASVVKIKGLRFTSESGVETPINSAWHFFETMYQSGVYWKFLGVSQLIAGFLLMTQRFSKLGAVINFPIVLNIFIITLSYYFAYTPVITGAMLLVNGILLIWHFDELKILFNLPVTPHSKSHFETQKTWEVTGLALFLFTFFYRIAANGYNIFFWSGICFIIGLIGLLVGINMHKTNKT